MYEKKNKNSSQKCGFLRWQNQKTVMKFYLNFSGVLYKMSLVSKMQWERTEKSGKGVVQIGEGKKAIKKGGKPPEIQGKRA